MHREVENWILSRDAQVSPVISAGDPLRLAVARDGEKSTGGMLGMNIFYNQGTWDSELERLVKETWEAGQTFNIADVYKKFQAHFSRLYPSDSSVQDKLRKTLQHLRDQGVLEFVDDDGTYRRI